MSANPELIQQARSADPDMRQKAAYLVSHSSDAGDFPLMFELLGDKDWRVRKTIVDGFVRDPRGEVIERLLDALGDRRPRRAAGDPSPLRGEIPPQAGARSDWKNRRRRNNQFPSKGRL